MHFTRRRADRFGAFCLATTMVAVFAAAPSPGQNVPGERTRSETVALVQQVNVALGLKASEIVHLELDRTPGAPVLTIIPVDSQPAVLHLEPWSVRSASYQVLVQQADGSLAAAAPAPVRTLRGSLLGIPGTAAAGSLLDDGLHATVRFADGTSIWIEPIGGRVAGAGDGDHAIYRASDILPVEGTCATNDALLIAEEVGAAFGGGVAGTGLCTTELACDADFEYFQDWGSVTGVENRINAVINTVNVQYERDVDITHVITTIIVRAFEPDPYSSTDAVTLLNQFRNQWEANHGSINRDMAQLFTGKELNSSTIGVAWLSAVCTSFGYSLVQSDFNNNFSCATDLSAHELGHNWGADHCSCTSYTMNPFITCANVFHPTFSIPEIIDFRDTRPCLDCGPPPQLGACCLSDGLCVLKNPTDCANLGGTYQGDGTDCASVNCPQPNNGACCFSDGTCSVETSGDCASLGGTYQGDGTDCSPNNCPQPTGACCFGDGTCSVETAADCASLGGTYEGDGVTCAAANCPQPPATGACCFGDGTCSVETAADCASLGGTYEGDDVTCAAANCPQPPTGACCFTDGTCSDETAADCASLGGAYEGDNTACATTNCPQPPGPEDVPLTSVIVTKGSAVGGLMDLVDSDNSWLAITAAAEGNKRRTETIVVATSSFSSVSQLDITVETTVDTNKVKTTVYLKRWSNNKWTRLGSFNQAEIDTETVFANVSNPNLYVNGAGEIEIRIFTEKKTSSPYVFRIDHVEVIATP